MPIPKCPSDAEGALTSDTEAIIEELDRLAMKGATAARHPDADGGIPRYTAALGAKIAELEAAITKCQSDLAQATNQAARGAAIGPRTQKLGLYQRLLQMRLAV